MPPWATCTRPGLPGFQVHFATGEHPLVQNLFKRAGGGDLSDTDSSDRSPATKA